MRNCLTEIFILICCWCIGIAIVVLLDVEDRAWVFFWGTISYMLYRLILDCRELYYEN